MNFTHAYVDLAREICIDVLNPETGKSWFKGEDLHGIRKRYPAAEIVSLEEFQRQKASRQDQPFSWEEITKDRYEEMLQVLPPLDFDGLQFLVDEPCDHHALTGYPRYAAYRQQGGKFFTSSRPITRKEFKSCN